MNTLMSTLSIRPMSLSFLAPSFDSPSFDSPSFSVPTYRRWATGLTVTTTANAAVVIATAANLGHAWDIKGDAPSFQVEDNKCMKRPQSWSEPPGS